MKKIPILCLSVLGLCFAAQWASAAESQFCQDLRKAAKGDVLSLPLKGVEAVYEKHGISTESKMFQVLTGALKPSDDLRKGIDGYLSGECGNMSLGK
ncbi:hypothetical protein N9530_01905 [Ascidiaceihabitans sp.]|jgi:hypothetical protein|nr:hypothetical protein [Ascidiaceihabitans sp.]